MAINVSLSSKSSSNLPTGRLPPLNRILLILTCDPVDIAEVIDRVPSAAVPPERATQLRHLLNLQSNEPTGSPNLREFVDYRHRCKSPLTLEDLVRALMLTPGLGRYVAKLLPFCKLTMTSLACTCTCVPLSCLYVWSVVSYMYVCTWVTYGQIIPMCQELSVFN